MYTEVGLVSADGKGKIMENNQFEPDIEIRNDYDRSAIGQDQQLERAVSEIMLIIDE